jgi:hypothetical protein
LITGGPRAVVTQIKANVAGACRLLHDKNYCSLDQLLATIRSGDIREIAGIGSKARLEDAQGITGGPTNSSAVQGRITSGSHEESSAWRLTPASLFHSLDAEHAEVNSF